MTTWVEDVLALIDAESTRLSVGVNLFANTLPDDVRSVAAAVFERPGEGPDDVYADLSAFERPGIQVVVRTTAPADGASAPSPLAARAEAWKAYVALNKVTNQALSTASTRTFGAIDLNEPPFLADVDDEGRHMFAFSGTAWVTPSTGSW